MDSGEFKSTPVMKYMIYQRMKNICQRASSETSEDRTDFSEDLLRFSFRSKTSNLPRVGVGVLLKCTYVRHILYFFHFCTVLYRTVHVRT